MLKLILCTAVAGTCFLAMGFADQPQGRKVIQINRTSPVNGKVMYQSYCAPCHGVDGRGNGPAAAAMKTQPTDLTQLSKENKGKFPETHVASVLQFGSSLPAHGSAEMPIWGQLFGKIVPASLQQTSLRISNLTYYLETIQAH